MNTYNLYVDTSRGHSANSKGDDFELNLGHTNIVADEGQYIRLSLNNFSMHKVFTDINETNNKFKLYYNKQGDITDIYTNELTLTKRNNTTLNALATDFANAIGNGILGRNITGVTEPTSFTISDLTPSSTTSVGGDSDYIISFKLTFNTAHNLDNPRIYFLLDDGDTNEILGGDRLESSNGITMLSYSSVDISKTSTTEITVTCKYPAQRQTIDHIFLRAVGTQNTSIETLGFLNPTETHKADVTDSDILAKIPVM